MNSLGGRTGLAAGELLLLLADGDPQSLVVLAADAAEAGVLVKTGCRAVSPSCQKLSPPLSLSPSLPAESSAA